MLTNAKRLHKDLATRKATSYREIPLPTWEDFRRGGEGRRLWLRRWFRNFPLDLVQLGNFFLYTVLPISFVSWWGGWTARQIIPRAFPGMVLRTMANLRLLYPDWSEAKCREVTWRQFDNLGRLHSEYPILHRLLGAGRITIKTPENFATASKAGPVVLVGIHLGNWEVIGPVSKMLNIPGFFVHQPQKSRIENYLLRKVRRKNSSPGSVTMPPGPGLVRQALKWLKQGKGLLIYCDDAVGGLSVAPFFDRAPHLNSNYAIAVRMARQSNASIIFHHVVRERGAHFTIEFGPPIKLPPAERPGDRLLEDVKLLNDLVEPIIKAHVDQWYWINWPAPGVNYHYPWEPGS